VNVSAVRKIASILVLLLLCVSVFLSVAAFAAEEDQRVRLAGQAMNEILNAREGIPQRLLDKAACIMVFPSVEKGAFGVVGSYGRGVMVCRGGPHYTGPWGAPALYALEGHSVKFPGGRNTGFVLLVTTPQAARSLLSGTTKLGSQLTTSAGPTALDASAEINAAILAYSRKGGLFNGISLAGSILRSDSNADQKLYGKKKLTAQKIIVDHAVEVPAAAQQLVALLNSKSPSNPS
jgi:SH3 domain-containing YSC84-like protein 1